jgi:hypothetical protein
MLRVEVAEILARAWERIEDFWYAKRRDSKRVTNGDNCLLFELLFVIETRQIAETTEKLFFFQYSG